MEGRKTIPPDDTQFVEEARKGSHESFAILVERHQKMLTAFAQQRLGDARHADDIVQATFVKAWTHIASYRGEADFRAWLCGIAINECRAVHRSSRQRGEVPITPELEESLAGTGEPLDHAPLRRTLRREVARLPPRQQSVLSLRIFADLPFGEIARLEGITTNSAKVNYHYAVRRLKEWLV